MELAELGLRFAVLLRGEYAGSCAHHKYSKKSFCSRRAKEMLCVFNIWELKNMKILMYKADHPPMKI